MTWQASSSVRDVFTRIDSSRARLSTNAFVSRQTCSRNFVQGECRGRTVTLPASATVRRRRDMQDRPIHQDPLTRHAARVRHQRCQLQA